MNLAILIGRFPPGPQGGAEYQAEAWARHLADRHRVTVVTRRETGARGMVRERRDGFEVVRLPRSPVPVWRTVGDALGIDRVVRDLSPPPDLLLCFQTFISGWAGVRLQRRLGVPAVVWVRGEGEYRFHGTRVQRWLNPATWRDARGVLVQTEAGRRGLLEALDRVDPAGRVRVASRLEVVPNGIDLPPTPAAADPGGAVLSVGRLIPHKGMDLVIEACALAARRLDVAGVGPERERLEALARSRGVEARFLGHLAHDELGRHYAAASCVVLAARRGEGLPNVLLEAMAWGRPVVATPIAGVRDLVVDGLNGLVVPAGDAAALGAALERLAHEPALAARLAAGARRTAESFAWDHVRPRLESVLERWRVA